MEKLVSVVIPFYRETEAQLMIVLSSLNNQVGINFARVEVILINDGGDEIDEETFLPYFTNLQIHYYRYDDNKGAGFARMIGTDMANGQYVMYMDADDQLQYVGALLDFFNVVRYHGDHEVIIGKYVEETKRAEGFRYFQHGNNDWKSPVAKWFNQAYLKRIRLTWREDLRVFEDTYFVGVACELAHDIYRLDAVVYNWMYHPDSTVRTNGGQDFYRQLDQWARCHRYYFTMIQKYQPERLVADYLAYMADVYLRAQLYRPADPQAFQQEHQALLKKFPQQWHQIKAILATEIQNLIDKDPLYQRFNTNGVAAFIHSQDELLKNYVLADNKKHL